MTETTLLIFDLDDTLISYGNQITEKAWFLTCNKLVNTYNLDFDAKIIAAEILRINASIWENEARIPKGSYSSYELRKSIVTEALDHLNLTNSQYIDFLVKNYAQYKYDSTYLFADVYPTLATLKSRGYTTALLTNGNSSTQREKIKRFNLDPLLDYIFIDSEIGVSKPNEEAYAYVLNSCNIPAKQAWMIGDNYLWEVIAPIRYGLKAIWVKRDDKVLQNDTDISPTHVIKEIAELLTLFP